MAETLLVQAPGVEKPEAKDIAAWFRRLWPKWQPRRELDEEVRSRIYRTREPIASGPNGEEATLKAEIIRTGIARTLHREFTGIMSSDQPKIEALADGLGPKGNQRAAEIEEWDVAWYQNVEGDDTVQLVDGDQLAYGRGVSFTAWARQFWEGAPRWDRASERPDDYNKKVAAWRGERPNPIIWEHCTSPQTMFDEDIYDRFYGSPRCVYWEHRPLSELAEEFPDSPAAKLWREREEKKEAGDPYRLFLIFANRRYMAYCFADGVVCEAPDTEGGPVSLLTESAGLDKLEFLQEPFEHGCPGNPFVVQVGDTTGDRELKNRYSGIFDNSLDLIDRLDDVLSQYATGVRRYGRAQMKIERVPVMVNGVSQVYGVDEDGTPREIEYDPGKPLNLLPGEQQGWVQPPMDQFRSAVELHTLLSQYVSRDTLAPSSWGGGTATESGFQLVTLIQASERKLKPLIRRKAKAIQRVLDNVHALVCKIGVKEGITVFREADEESDGGSTVAVGGLVTLTPKQALKARIRVRLKPNLESAQAAKMQLGLQIAQVVSQGMLDLDKDWIVQEFFGQENPERHRRAALLQRYLNKPEVDKWMTTFVLKYAEMQLQAEEAEQVKALQTLSTEDLMLAPAALQQALAAKGLVPPGTFGATGLAGLLGGASAPGIPTPGSGGAPGLPSGQPAAQFTGGGAGPYGAALSAAASGQPASIPQAFG